MWVQLLFCSLICSIPGIKRAGSGLIDKIVSDKRSLKNLHLAEIGSDKEGKLVGFDLFNGLVFISINLPTSAAETSSVGASVRLESTLSEEAGSLSICQLSVPAALALQARIWLTIGKGSSNGPDWVVLNASSKLVGI